MSRTFSDFQFVYISHFFASGVKNQYYKSSVFIPDHGSLQIEVKMVILAYITKVKFLAGGYLPPLWHFGRGGVLPQKKILEGGYWGGYQIPKFFRDFFAGIFFFCSIKIRFRALRARKFFFVDFLRGGVPSPWASPRGGVRTPPLDFSRGGVNPIFCSQRGGRPPSPPPMVMYATP